MLDETDASLFYALLRFEEASSALRVALRLRIVDNIGDSRLSLKDLQQRFGFTHQASRTYFSLLVVMRVLETSNDRYQVSSVAKRTLTSDVATSRVPYLSMGMADDVMQLILMLQGNSGETPPLYGEPGGGGSTEPSGEPKAGETLMDIDEIGATIAHGLSSRARNFAVPLADSIARAAGQANSIADIGAGSPYVADACLKAMPGLERAILVDRPNGMRFAREIATRQGMDTSRFSFSEQDFFAAVPVADIYCISNTAHDWLRQDYLRLMHNVRAAISRQGLVCIHEPLLRTSWSSDQEWLEALWMACYALTLFKLTAGQGSCYSVGEHDEIHEQAGFTRLGDPVRTCDGCSALFYRPSHS